MALLRQVATFGYQNKILSGTLLVGSAWAGLGGDNLKLPRGDNAESWRTAAGVKTSWLQVDAGTIIDWQAFTLHRTNFTSTASVRIWVGPVSGLNQIVPWTGAGVSAGYGQTNFILSTPVQGQFAKIEIDDPTNQDGYLQVGLAYAGPVVQLLSRNISKLATFGHEVGGDEVETRGGQKFYSPRWSRRTWDLAHSYGTPADIWQRAQEIDAVARTGTNILVVPDPFDVDVDRQAIFGTWKSSDVTEALGPVGARSWSVRVTERL